MRAVPGREGLAYVSGIRVALSGAALTAHPSLVSAEPRSQLSEGSPTDVGVRATAEAAEIVWVRQFGTASGDLVSGEEARHLALDASGVYVAGNIAGALPGQTFAGNFGAFVAKLAIPNAAPTPPTLGAMGVYIFDDATGGDCYLIGTWSGAGRCRPSRRCHFRDSATPLAGGPPTDIRGELWLTSRRILVRFGQKASND